jgi:hypothetical protein
MRTLGIVSLVFAGVLLLVGCDGATSSSSDFKTKRDECVRDMKKELDAADAKIKEWNDKILTEQGPAKVEMEKKAAEAKVKRDEAEKKLGELKDASADRWEKIKEGAGSAFADLKKSVE